MMLPFLGLLLFEGCSCQPDPAVTDAYTAARKAALAKPGPAPADWRPDAVLTLSPRWSKIWSSMACSTTIRENPPCGFPRASR